MTEVSKEQKDVLYRVGATLLLIQSTERIIDTCLQLALPGTPLTLERMTRERNQHSKPTLGQFFRKLRQRVDLHPQFDALLDSYLERRNTLIHRLDEIPGWSLGCPEGREVALSFLDCLIRLDDTVRGVFIGLLHAWQMQQGWEIPVDQSIEAIARRYRPLIDDLFYEKGG